MLKEKSDGELIALYNDSGNQSAIRLLVERHYERIYRRFSREVRNEADANDLSQKLWLQVTRNLDRYEDEGKFPQFLSTVATNILNDHWRQTGTRNRYIVEVEETEDVLDLESDAVDPERSLANDQLLTRLVTELIPALPPEQRMAWLLRHESEYWEPAQRFEWKHLAELNGISSDEAWEKFDAARHAYLRIANTSVNGPGSSSSSKDDANCAIGDEEQVIFMIWTQANRPRKDQSFSWDYFANLLGVPVNTMKTRYRSAQQALAARL